jgi:hypothetical protein
MADPRRARRIEALPRLCCADRARRSASGQAYNLDFVEIRFEDIRLEKPQKEVLAAMVEAERAVQAKDRQEFLLIGTTSGWFNAPSRPEARRSLSR